jgi:tetratricopeptide (TPR) repeat protein
VHFGLGYLHWRLKHYDDAEPQFKAELALDPNHPQALAYLGDIAMKRDDPDAAVPLLKKALEAHNDIRIAHLDLGIILTQQKQYPAAAAALKRALELDPEQPDAHYRLGRVYQATGRPAEAQKEFARVRELHEKAEQDVARKMSSAPPPLPQ